MRIWIFIDLSREDQNKDCDYLGVPSTKPKMFLKSEVLNNGQMNVFAHSSDVRVCVLLKDVGNNIYYG